MLMCVLVLLLSRKISGPRGGKTWECNLHVTPREALCVTPGGVAALQKGLCKCVQLSQGARFKFSSNAWTIGKK